jgi:hypothetical protein
MAAAIDMMPRKLPDGDYSHTGSWAFLRKNQLKHVGVEAQVLNEKGRGIRSDWSEFDTVYIYHTMDFEPDHPYCINVFDGPQEHTAKYFERIIWAVNSHVKLVSLDYPMPNYGYRCKRKKERASETSKMSDYWRNVDWDAVQAKCDAITDWILDPGVEFTKPYQGRTKDLWIKQCEGIKHLHDRVVMGDSHAHSAYTPKSLVLRKDGRTLRGITKKGIQKEITDFGYDYKQVKALTCYWGNIDVRHHLCRESDPKQATLDLLKAYEAELLKHRDMQIEVVSLLPIEDESRKLPSTGYYLGTPFYGSRAQRQEIVKLFNDTLREMANRHGWTMFNWPEAWYTMDGVEFMSEILERPRSVHLARKFYRWDLENDCPNPNLQTEVGKKTGLLEF